MKKKMRSNVSLAVFILGFIAILLPGNQVFAHGLGDVTKDISIVLEGKEITSNYKVDEPFRLNENVYMAVKVLNTALGLDVNYDKQSNSIYIGKYQVKPEKNAEVKSDKMKLMIDEELVTLTDSLGNTLHPVRLNNSIYIPVMTMKQQFDKEVIYDAVIKTVFIEDKNNMGNTKVRTLASPQYKYINSINDGLIGVNKNNKYGYIDLSGNSVVPIEYKNIQGPSDGLIAVQKDKLFGYSDYKGKLVIPYLFDSVSPFDGDMAFAVKNGKTVHINRQGKTIFTPHANYESHQKIDDESFFIKIEGKERIVNRQGKILRTLPYDDVIYYFDEWDLAIVRQGRKYGYINKHGEELVPPIYDDSPENILRIGDKDGFFDYETKKIFKPIYDYMTPFAEGLAAASLNSKIGYINQQGETVIPFEYDEVQEFSDGLAAVSQGQKYGYINQKGDIVVPLIYDKVISFNNGYGIVKQGDMEGLVNKTGDMIIPLQDQYELSGVYSEDIIIIYDHEKRKYGAINIEGNIVVEADCANFLYEYIEGIYQIDRFALETETSAGQRKVGLANRKGEVVIPREYDSITHLLNNDGKPLYEEIFMVEKDGVFGLMGIRDF